MGKTNSNTHSIVSAQLIISSLRGVGLASKPGWLVETHGLAMPISARFRHVFATFRQRIGLFDPLFDTILAPGDPFLAGFSGPNRVLVGPKEGGIPSLVEETVLAGPLPSDSLYEGTC